MATLVIRAFRTMQVFARNPPVVQGRFWNLGGSIFAIDEECPHNRVLEHMALFFFAEFRSLQIVYYGM
jgi:hypothetical protein